MYGGNIDQKETGGQWRTLRVPHRDRSRYVGSALQDEGALPSCNEGCEPVDHVQWSVLGEEEGP